MRTSSARHCQCLAPVFLPPWTAIAVELLIIGQDVHRVVRNLDGIRISDIVAAVENVLGHAHVGCYWKRSVLSGWDRWSTFLSVKVRFCSEVKAHRGLNRSSVKKEIKITRRCDADVREKMEAFETRHLHPESGRLPPHQWHAIRDLNITMPAHIFVVQVKYFSGLLTRSDQHLALEERWMFPSGSAGQIYPLCLSIPYSLKLPPSENTSASRRIPHRILRLSPYNALCTHTATTTTTNSAHELPPPENLSLSLSHV